MKRSDSAAHDSARASLRTAYWLSQAYDPAPEEFRSELRAPMDSARSQVLLMRLLAPESSVVRPNEGRLRLVGVPTCRARIWLLFTDPGGRVVHSDSQGRSWASALLIARNRELREEHARPLEARARENGERRANAPVRVRIAEVRP